MTKFDAYWVAGEEAKTRLDYQEWYVRCRGRTCVVRRRSGGVN